MTATLTVNNKKNYWFFENKRDLKVFKFSIFTTNNTIIVHFNLFEKIFTFILSFLLYLLGESKLLLSIKTLPFGIKSINPIQKYLHITE